jgi:molybdopterin-guanine dinucleotide biosynthesis protein A
MRSRQACMILAGGRSTRMGRDKALLPLPANESVTFVEQLVSTCSPLTDELLLVVRDEAQAAQFALPGVRVVIDVVADHGPLMGLYSGLRMMRAERALVVAVDMPFLQAELASFLLSQPLTNALIVPVVRGVPQVLLTLYPRALLSAIEERLHEGRRDPRSLLDSVPVCFLEEAQLCAVDPQLRSFVNINTPEDLLS